MILTDSEVKVHLGILDEIYIENNEVANLVELTMSMRVLIKNLICEVSDLKQDYKNLENLRIIGR